MDSTSEEELDWELVFLVWGLESRGWLAGTLSGTCGPLTGSSRATGLSNREVSFSCLSLLGCDDARSSDPGWHLVLLLSLP